VTQRTTTSTLKKIADKEDLSLTMEQLQAVAENSDGDIRNAINSLQVGIRDTL
jgi:DNA polymerase III delta prime subunit